MCHSHVKQVPPYLSLSQIVVTKTGKNINFIEKFCLNLVLFSVDKNLFAAAILALICYCSNQLQHHVYRETAQDNKN